MTKISWLRRARRDLLRQARRKAEDNPSAATEIYDTIISRTDTLDEHPFKGRRGRLQGTRELVITGTPYIVIYRVGPHVLTVLKVIHGAQKWPPKRR